MGKDNGVVNGIPQFPYKKTRLMTLPWKEIIAKGERWSDPTFPHGPQTLFINGRNHQTHNDWDYSIDPKRKFYWRRASDHFKDHECEVTLFDGIDPTDIVQGKIANCYFLAALAGLAEDPPSMKEENFVGPLNQGLRVRDNFLTKDANAAGCYSLVMTIDGEDLEIVVDDWFPFYIDSSGKESFCFSRTKGGKDDQCESSEIWVMILEKAWAKVCGSYEAAEMGTASEAFNNIDGTPTQNYIIDQIDKSG